MPRPTHTTTLLPRKLRDELGLPDTHDPDRHSGSSRKSGQAQSRGARKSSNGPAQSRKDKRRSEREEKKAVRRPVGRSDREREKDGKKSRGVGDAGGNAPLKSILKKKAEEVDDEPDISEDELDDDILNEDDDDEEQDDEVGTSEEEEERSARPKVPRAVQDKLAQDDAEIAALEKALGIKNKKLPKAFKEDGLDELMGDLAEDSDTDTKKRKRDSDAWLQRKRQKALAPGVGQGLVEDESGISDSEDGLPRSDDEDESNGDADSFDGFGDEDASPAPQKKPRENPYVAPVSSAPSTKKYIPPSLRTATSSTESESLTRLRRQAQGHINKLSEANLITILSEIEKLYQSHPRQDVTTTLIDLLLGLICSRSSLNDTFINLHAGFIAAVYKVVGMDFGAQLVQRVVEQFDTAYEEQQGSGSSKETGKEMANLLTLISHLYNLRVVGCGLVFDYIRLILKEINELNTELLLKIIKSSGPQLRQDDPSALKDIVLLMQPAISQVGEAALSVRTKFMIEAITDLKNNKLKATFAGISAEQITKMRKILGALNSRNIRASEPLRIGREDIHNSDKKGKWWLVGASWKNDAATDHQRLEKGGVIHSDAVLPDTLHDGADDATVDLTQLAKTHRMNTDVRRSIFVAIMSATDCRDAHIRLAKLRLKRNQEGEIPHVLMHCASEEESHNPYYTLIARKLCGEKRMKMAFMFSLWDVFKRMGERNNLNDDDDDPPDVDDGENALSTRATVNLAKMYGNLVADGSLTLGILKMLDFMYLQPKTKTFAELLLITAILKTQQRQPDQTADSEVDEKKLVDVFMRTRDTPQVVAGLIFFIRKVVAKSDVVSSKREKKLLKSGCRVALDTLKVVSQGQRDIS